MRKLIVVPILVGLLAACGGDDTTPSGGSPDGGTAGKGAGGAAGKGGGIATAGSAGTSLTGGAGGSAEMGGTAGTGGAATDASADTGVVVDAPSGPDGDGPIVYAEASTCAGYALQFDGNSTSTSVTRMVQDDFTLEAWFKTSTTLNGTNFWDGAGFIYADISGNNNDFGTSILNNKLAFGMGNITTDAGLTELTMQSNATVTTGQWTHVAVTRNKTSGLVQIFLNGQLDSSTVAENHNSLTAQASITFGGNTIDNHYFVGTMDEVRIWNVVRTQAEIASTMHRVLTGDEAGLAGYWRFDVAGATSAVDSSQGMNAATFSLSPPSWVPSDAPVCDKPAEAGTSEASAPEASTPEASTPEAGVPEASLPDVGADVSTPDSSVTDAAADGE